METGSYYCRSIVNLPESWQENSVKGHRLFPISLPNIPLPNLPQMPKPARQPLISVKCGNKREYAELSGNFSGEFQVNFRSFFEVPPWLLGALSEPLTHGQTMQEFVSLCFSENPPAFCNPVGPDHPASSSYPASRAAWERSPRWDKVRWASSVAAVPIACPGLYSLVWFWPLTAHQRKPAWMPHPWYPGKSRPSLADAWATLRRAPWQESIFSQSDAESDLSKNRAHWINVPAWAT